MFLLTKLLLCGMVRVGSSLQLLCTPCIVINALMLLHSNNGRPVYDRDLVPTPSTKTR